MTDVEVKVVSNKLRVCLNGILHLSIDITELIGVQSFTYKADRWHIDFIMKSNKIECWYTTKEIWENILRGIEKIDLA